MSRLFLFVSILIIAGCASSTPRVTDTSTPEDRAVMRDRYLDLKAALDARPLKEKPRLEKGIWVLSGLPATSSTPKSPGRILLDIALTDGDQTTPIGSMHIADGGQVEVRDGAIIVTLPFPYDRFNLSVGGKLKPGIWEGKQVFTITDTTITIDTTLTALAASETMNVPFITFDADYLDDAYVYRGDRAYLLDLGLEAGAKPLPDSTRLPTWAQGLGPQQLGLLTRYATGVVVDTASRITGATAYYPQSSQTTDLLAIHGTGFHVQPGHFGGLVRVTDIEKGATVHVTQTIRGHHETDPSVLPPDVAYPPLKWSEARYFDTHGHIEQDMNIDQLIRTCRKNKIIFGVLSIEFIEGPGQRAFLGDMPVYEAMRKAPDVIVAMGFININGSYPGCPEGPITTAADIERFQRLGFLGFKSIQKWGGTNVDDPSVTPVYAAIAAHRMPIVFHSNKEWLDRCGPGRIAAVAQAHPGIPGVGIAHGDPSQPMGPLFEVLRTTPNLYQQHMHFNSVENLRKFRDAGLAHKIVFATDRQRSGASVVSEAAKFATLLEAAGYTEAERDFSSVGYARAWFPNVDFDR